MDRLFNIMNPFDYLSLAMQQQKLTAASVETIWRRSSLYSRGALSLVEAVTMCVEKPASFAEGFEKGAKALARGKAPVAVIEATMAPMVKTASSNARRLRR